MSSGCSTDFSLGSEVSSQGRAWGEYSHSVAREKACRGQLLTGFCPYSLPNGSRWWIIPACRAGGQHSFGQPLETERVRELKLSYTLYLSQLQKWKKSARRRLTCLDPSPNCWNTLVIFMVLLKNLVSLSSMSAAGFYLPVYH